MKKRMIVLVSLVVAVLIGVGNVFAQDGTSNIPDPPLGPEWELAYVGSNNGSALYFNTRSITYLPGGFVKVWVLDVPRGWSRGITVGFLKANLLSEGKDPNNAERYWYDTDLYEFNCQTHQFTVLEDIYYSFGRRVLDDEYSHHEEWEDIPSGIGIRDIEDYVCEPEVSIPEPSLGPEWKLVARRPDGTTDYFNTRKITYLPNGIVKVWELWVPRGGTRWVEVDALKGYLSLKGEDTNNAEEYWYETFLDKFNCKTHKYAILEGSVYSFGQTVLAHRSFQTGWVDISPGSVHERIERYVCK